MAFTRVCYIARMRLIYTHPNLLIAPGETWIELWIVNDEQASAAMRRIQEIEHQPDEEEWDCHHCKEPNPATFELCWQCQTQRQA